MRHIDENVVKAKNDKAYREILISEYESFILKTAYKITGEYISKSDDRWSVSLFAFHEAVQSYTYEKGRFLPFAEMVIRRRLYDYLKKQSKSACEQPVNPFSFGNDMDDENEDRSIKRQIIEKTSIVRDDSAKWEIEAITRVLEGYGFSFFDLVSVSPKAIKTKTVCAKVIVFMTQNIILLDKMRKSKNLPVKIIKNNLHVPQKIIERHRKYIIAAVEIVSGDYPILCEYLRYVKEELSK